MQVGNSHIAALVLRVGFGVYMLLGHGLGKFLKLISGDEIHFPSVLGLSPTIGLALTVLAEFIAAIMIIIGLKTKYASILLMITMAVAAFVVHLNDPWFAKNADGGSKEMAMIYLIGFIGIYFLGSGKYSIDNKIGNSI